MSFVAATLEGRARFAHTRTRRALSRVLAARSSRRRRKGVLPLPGAARGTALGRGAPAVGRTGGFVDGNAAPGRMACAPLEGPMLQRARSGAARADRSSRGGSSLGPFVGAASPAAATRTLR